MKELKIIRDENLISNNDILEYESRIDINLPKEYREFLLKNNGCSIYPSIPSIDADTNWEIWEVERILSLGDLNLQLDYTMHYDDKETIKEYDKDKYDIEINNLLTIASGTRGNYYIYLGKEDFGRMYFSCYSDWDGLVKLNTNSFNDFLGSMKSIENSKFEPEHRTNKIQDNRYYYTPDKPKLGIKRFDEVLSYIGDINSQIGSNNYTVIQHYAYFNKYNKMGKYIFYHLLNKGADLEGVLLKCRDFETIKYLINEHNVDFNKGKNGWYPIHMLTGISSWATIKENYELLDKLLNSQLEIDYTIKDPNGETPKERLSKMIVEYEKYRAYDKKFWESKPAEHKFITSKAINEFLGIISQEESWTQKLLNKITRGNK